MRTSSEEAKVAAVQHNWAKYLWQVSSGMQALVRSHFRDMYCAAVLTKFEHVMHVLRIIHVQIVTAREACKRNPLEGSPISQMIHCHKQKLIGRM